MPADPQVIDMAGYFKQATLWGFLFVVLPAVIIVGVILFGRRIFKKKLPEEEIKPQTDEKKAESEPSDQAENL